MLDELENCGVGGSNVPATDTPIWDALFQTVSSEDPSGHMLSIHNNYYLYNNQHYNHNSSKYYNDYSRQPWRYKELFRF